MKPLTATLRFVAERAPIGYVVVACLLSLACRNVVPGEGLACETARTAAAALCAGVFFAVGGSWPHRLGREARREGERKRKGNPQPASSEKAFRKNPGKEGSEAVRSALPGFRPAFAFVCFWLLAAACVVGIGSLLAQGAALLPADSFAAGPSRLPGFSSASGSASAFVSSLGETLLFVALCLVTGLFEEALFRGVMFRGFARSFAASDCGRPLVWAAVASSCVFGVLHVSGGAPVSDLDAVLVAQAVFKSLQAGLFGFVMAGVFAGSRNLWLACGLHAAFNVLSEGPLFLAASFLPGTYLTGSLVDVALLAISIVLFLPAVAKARTWLAGACIM